MEQLTEEQLDAKFRNRRKMAWRSWWFMTVAGLSLLIFALSSDAAAARVDASSWVITLVFGGWATIVFTYFGVTALYDWRGQ